MNRSCHHLKIARTVVQFVSVLVVNYLPRCKWPANLFCHDKPVLANGNMSVFSIPVRRRGHDRHGVGMKNLLHTITVLAYKYSALPSVVLCAYVRSLSVEKPNAMSAVSCPHSSLKHCLNHSSLNGSNLAALRTRHRHLVEMLSGRITASFWIRPENNRAAW